MLAHVECLLTSPFFTAMNLPYLSVRSVSIAGIASILSTIFFPHAPAIAQSSGCTLTLLQGILPSAIVPGRLAVSEDNTTFSSLLPNGSSSQIGLVCTQAFTASINDEAIQQTFSTGETGETEFAVMDAEVTDIDALSLLGLLTLPSFVVTIDLTATAPDTGIIGSGTYSFVVPVAIVGN